MSELPSEKWQELHPTGTDRPHIRVWWPTELPTARLQTVTVGGPHGDEVLPKGDPMAYVTLGGVEFGGRLDELELFLAAATEALGHVRGYADKLLQRREEASAE